MGFLSRKALLIGAPVLFGLFLLGGLYLMRREAYVLNKNVRLVTMRLLQYEELSRHRNRSYRLEFLRDSYRVSIRQVGKREWKEVASLPYEKTVEAAQPGFAIEMSRGKIINYYWQNGWRGLDSTFILSFVSKKKTAQRRGILFLKEGRWRIF